MSSTPEDPARTLARLMAREAISEVLATVAHSQDANDWDRLAACFWPDAVYRHPGGVIEGCHDLPNSDASAVCSDTVERNS